MPERAAFYVDGFNLYHAINDLGQPHLKWLNIWALGAHVIPRQSQELVRVVWCTAVKTNDNAKMLRHRALIKAMRAVGVTCLEGHFIGEDRECHGCGNAWKAPVEKQGDVNLSISLIDDAHRNLFDHAYLITADSDQAATVRLFSERFPGKTITSVSPPGRGHSKHILGHTRLKIALSVAQLECCLFPRAVMKQGAVAAMRPLEYDPPAGWVAPHLRPQAKQVAIPN